ncbi:MAG: hypothetical protein IJZ98_01870 [Bacteroidales bacterium]|nr:hypothetical protein [Bacteroidales bacterium]
MKKASILLISALMAVLSGCQTDTVQETMTGNDPHKIFAVIEEDAATKTSLNRNNRILWSEGDQITVFQNSRSGSVYQVAPEYVGSSSAAFVCVENKSKGVTIGADVAFYPYKSGMYCTALGDGKYEINDYDFPAVQTYVADSFCEESYPMAAVSEVGSDDFSFRNISGVLKLLLTGSEAVKSITLKGNADEILSGKGVVTVGSGEFVPEVTFGTSVGKVVTLDCTSSPVSLNRETPTAFLIALPPVTFEKGFNVVIEGVSGGKMTLNTSNKAVIARSSILRMPPVEFVPVGGILIEEVSKTFNEVIVRVHVRDAVQYSGGCVPAGEFSLPAVLKNANWKISPRITDKFEYEGPLTGFPNVEPVPVSSGQKYVLWVAPYKQGQTLLKQADIVYKEFTVPEVVSGGEVNVVCTDVDSQVKSVKASLSAEGASMIYSALLTAEEAKSCSTDASRVRYLFDKTTPSKGGVAEVSRDGLDPNTTLVLIALAIDDQGRYGDLLTKNLSTSVPEFNEEFQIRLGVKYEEKTAFISVDGSSSDVVYYYFVGKTSSSLWKRHLGGTRESAEEFMVLNLDSYMLKNTEDVPMVDGCVVYDNLEMGEEHVAVVMAVDQDGVYSRAFIKYFTPKLDLGNFVYKSGETKTLWTASRPAIKFGTCDGDTEFYTVNWYVEPAEGMTAYTACAHPNAFDGCTTPEAVATMVYNLGVKVVPDRMETLYYGTEDNYVYVTWCDADGNFYETYSVPVP